MSHLASFLLGAVVSVVALSYLGTRLNPVRKIAGEWVFHYKRGDFKQKDAADAIIRLCEICDEKDQSWLTRQLNIVTADPP